MTPVEASTQLLLHFNELGASFVDSSARELKLQFVSGVSASASSKFGAACYLDTGGSGTTPMTAPLMVDTRVPMMVDFWINLSSYRTDNTCIVVGANPLLFVGVTTNGAGGCVTFVLYDSGNNSVVLTSPNAIPLNQWVHVLVGIDESLTRRIFYAGEEQVNSASAISHRTATVRGDFGIGGLGANTRIDGRLDELRYVFGYPCPSSDFTPPAAPYADILRSSLDSKVGESPLRIVGSAPPAANYKTGPQTPFSLRDTIDGGRGQIVGTVKEKATPSNLPLRRKVRLFHEFSGRFVRETWSNDAGDYVFTGIDRTQRYTVVSYDYLNNYRAVIADNILPEAM